MNVMSGHALVTGASSGIGEAVVKALASEGHSVTLIARRETELRRVAKEIGPSVGSNAMAYDLGDTFGIAELVRRAEAKLGPVDVLVNNAGFELVGRSNEIALEQIERIMRINFLASCAMTQAVVPGMIQRGRGTIVDVASVAAYACPPFLTYYSASKAALEAVSVSLRREFKKHGIHVVTVYPGPIRTLMTERGLAGYRGNPTMGLPWGTPQVLAGRIVRAIKRHRGTVIYPRLYWLGRLFPSLNALVMSLAPTNAK